MMPRSWNKPTTEVVEAMDEVVSEMGDVDVKPVAPTDKEPGAPADKQMLVRCTEPEKDLWKKAADKNGETLAAYVRRTLTNDANRSLSCRHPQQAVRMYPWGNPPLFCTLCNTRIEPHQISMW